MAENPGDTMSEKIPALRWQIPAVLMVSVLIAYFDRMNISYAIPKIARDYGWTVKETGAYGGLLMSMFYVGYGLANIFLSPLAERFGPRKSLVLAVCLFSFFTVLGAPFGMMFSAFLAVRILLGVSEGVHFPMNNIITKQWFPLHERSRANGLWVSGIFFSMILAPFIVVPIIDHFGWRFMFVVLGFAGMLVTVPLLLYFIHENPASHPRLEGRERRYIEAGMEKDEEEAGGFWEGVGVFMKKKTYWLALAGGVMNNMVAFGLLNWLPTYFTEGRGLPFEDLTYATSIPYAFSIVGIALWTFLGDRTNRRAAIAGVGFLVTGVLAYFAATAPTIALTVVLFACTIFMQVSYGANEYAIVQRIVPRGHVGTGVGFYNGIAMMAGGGLGPVIVGGIVSATGDYTMGLLALTGLCLAAGAIMLTLGRFLKY